MVRTPDPNFFFSAGKFDICVEGKQDSIRLSFSFSATTDSIIKTCSSVFADSAPSFVYQAFV